MTTLRRRMIEDMKLKNLSTRTINTYVSRVYNFATHFGRSPERLGRDDVRAYLLFLIQEKKVSWSVYNQTLCGLRFLYEVTLGRKDVLERIPFPKQAKRLPVVGA
jgi:integrase/recombinase XerD